MGVGRPIRKSLVNARWLRLGCLRLGGEKWRESGSLWEIEPEGLGDGLGEGTEKRQRSWFLGLGLEQLGGWWCHSQRSKRLQQLRFEGGLGTHTSGCFRHEILGRL